MFGLQHLTTVWLSAKLLFHLVFAKFQVLNIFYICIIAPSKLKNFNAIQNQDAATKKLDLKWNAANGVGDAIYVRKIRIDIKPFVMISIFFQMINIYITKPATLKCF